MIKSGVGALRGDFDLRAPVSRVKTAMAQPEGFEKVGSTTVPI